MSDPSGPVHPCPVDGSPHQTCTPEDGITWSGTATDLTERPDPGAGPLSTYVVEGVGVKLTDTEARRRGLLDDEEG